MPKINRPVDQASIINDLQRRVRTLEMASRVTTTNTVIPDLVPTNGSAAAVVSAEVRPVAYDGTPRSTAVRISDSQTVNLPQVTATGSIFLVVATWQSQGYGGGSGGVFKADDVTITIDMDGASQGWSWIWESPSGSWVEYYGDRLIGTMVTTSGEHTIRYRLSATEGNPAGTVDTRLADTSLVVIPVTF